MAIIKFTDGVSCTQESYKEVSNSVEYSSTGFIEVHESHDEDSVPILLNISHIISVRPDYHELKKYSNED